MTQQTRHRVPRISDGLFERALRDRGLCFVAVDEAKRAIFCTPVTANDETAAPSLAPFDFLVYQGDGPNLLVDTGRRNDCSIAKLREWGRLFGPDFLAVFARTRLGGRIVFVAAENGGYVPTTLGLAWTAPPNEKG